MELQERQIRKRLDEDFAPRIDVSDCRAHGETELAKIRASRALAALTVAASGNLSVEESCDSVVDESGDEGIDAIGISLARREVYIVQAKTSSGGPSPTEVMKFIQGIRYLLDWDWESLGPKAQRRRAEIEAALEDDVTVVAIYTHLGSEEPNEKARKISSKLLSEVNSSGEILKFRYEGLRENFERRNIASGIGSPDYDLVFERWVTMGDYRSEIMGLVTGEQLANLVEHFNERLFAKNIRSVLKSTETNQLLDETIRKSPSEFWYYNNGITIVANSISCKRTNPRSTDETFSLKGLSVVNGAQTCGALGRALRDGAALDDIRVTVRVISTGDHSANFGDLVTRYTNTQNQVTSRDFVSLDPFQQELSDTLLSEQIQYCFRAGQTMDLDEYDFAFDLEEATRALACYSGVGNSTRAKREIGRLWTDLNSNPYLEIYPRSLDAASMYNAVRFWRYFNASYIGVGKRLEPRSFGIIKNSVYMACALMMQSAKSDRVKFSDIDWDVENWISDQAEYMERLVVCVVALHEHENPGGFPMSFFKNQQKVEAFAKDVRANLKY